MASIHTIAAVCPRGHVVSYDIGRADPGFCQECGGRGISQCQACDAPLLGPEAISDVSGNLDTRDWLMPKFCHKCGAAFPWVDRQGRIHELENLLDRERIDPADELAVREQLDALASPDLDERDERRRWAKVKKLAPGLIENGRSIVIDLASKTIRDSLGL